MLSYQNIPQTQDGIAIVGIGGAGANILHCFASSSAEHVNLYSMSLDERVGRNSGNVQFVQLGKSSNRGLGSGGDPKVGREATEESRKSIMHMLEGKRLLVMVVGLGGGTGSGAAPVLARMAKEAGLFLVTVGIMPFTFEGSRRREQAQLSIDQLRETSDILFQFENDYMEVLFQSLGGARAVFAEADRLLARATAAIPTLASSPGLINIGLDELSSVMSGQDSRCLFGSGSALGANRAVEAAKQALSSPLMRYRNAARLVRRAIVHIAGGENLTMTEIRLAVETVRLNLKTDEVELFFGATVKESLGNKLRVTVIAAIDDNELMAQDDDKLEDQELREPMVITTAHVPMTPPAPNFLAPSPLSHAATLLSTSPTPPPPSSSPNLPPTPLPPSHLFLLSLYIIQSNDSTLISIITRCPLLLLVSNIIVCSGTPVLCLFESYHFFLSCMKRSQLNSILIRFSTGVDKKQLIIIITGCLTKFIRQCFLQRVLHRIGIKHQFRSLISKRFQIIRM